MQASLSFLWSLKRDEVVAALESRIVQLEQHEKAAPFHERQIEQDPATPNHVVEMFRIAVARDRGELEWTRSFRERVLAGAYSFAGETPDWIPGPEAAEQWRNLPDPPD
ncbi:hypothetical protein [Kribbella endophytica]